MKKFLILTLTFISFALINFASQAEIIGIKDEEKKFGDWKLYCQIDDMMGTSHCKIASKFYKNTAVLTIEPTKKFLNQFFLVIPQIKINSFVQIRIDRNDLILSKTVRQKDFGLIPLDQAQKNTLYKQMKAGNFLYLRFSVNDSKDEITARLSLKDFRNAIKYYKNQNQ